MAYNKKYRIQYLTRHGKPLIVQIKEDDYSGDIYRYYGKGYEHVKVNFEDVDLWEPVKPSNATIQMVATNNEQYDEFKNAKDRDYLIEIIDPKGEETKKVGSFTLNGLSSKERTYPKADIGDVLNEMFAYNLDRNWRYGGYKTRWNPTKSARAIKIRPDGKKIYFSDYDGLGSHIYQHTINTAFDLDTIASQPDDEIPFSARPIVRDICFNNDGTKMFLSSDDSYGDDSHNGVSVYTLIEAWNIYSGIDDDTFYDAGYPVGGFAFNSDGTKMYVGGGKYINQYDLPSPFQIDFSNKTGMVDAGHEITSLYLSPDDKYIMYGMSYSAYDTKQDVIWQLYLDTPGDINSWAFNYSVSFYVRYYIPIPECPEDDSSLEVRGFDFYHNGRAIAISGSTGLAYGYLLTHMHENSSYITCYNSLTLQLWDLSDSFISNMVYIIKYNGNDFYNSVLSAINDLIYYASVNTSKFDGIDTDNDDLLDALVYKWATTYNYKLKVRIDADPNPYEDVFFPGYSDETYGNVEFTEGHEGAILKLQSDENGTIVDLATYEMLQGTTKQDVIDSCIEQINNNFTEYRATTNNDNPYKIDILYTGSLAASEVTLGVVLGQDNPYWDAEASGLSEITVTAEQLLWKGYNIGGLFEKEYINEQYIVEIKASDGLADLDSEKWDFETGGKTLIKIIAETLQETELKLNINSAHDIFEDDFNQTASDDPLAQIYIDKESIVKKGFKTILNEKLKGFKILQDRGEWWIIRLDSSATFDYRKFDYKGLYFDNGSINPVLNIGTKTNYLNDNYGINLGRSGYFELDAGNKKYITKQTYGLKDQLLKDPTFAVLFDSQLKYWQSDNHSIYTVNSEDLIEVTGTTDEKSHIEQTVNDLQGVSLELSYQFEIKKIDDFSALDYEDVPRKKTVPLTNVSGYTPFLDLHDIDNYEFLEENLIVKLVDEHDYVDYTYITKIKDERAYLAKSDINDDYKRDIYVAKVYVEGLVQMDSILFYDGSELEEVGENDAQTFEIFNGLAKNNYPRKIDEAFEMSFSSEKIYDAKIRIYQGNQIDYSINKITLSPDGNFRKGIKLEKYYPESLDNYKDDPVNIELKIGDLPENYSNAGRLFLHGFFKNEKLTEITTSWNSGEKYFNIVSNRIIKQKSVNGYILTGLFMFPEFPEFKHILNDTIKSNKYSVKGMMVDFTSQKIDGEWIEIEKGEPGSLVTGEQLYEDDPAGTALYNDNRESFDSEGAGGGTVIVNEVSISKSDITRYSYLAESLGLIDKISFEGRSLDDNRKININHHRQRQLVFVTLFDGPKKVSPANFELKCINQNTIEIQLNYPVKSNTQLNLLIL